MHLTATQQVADHRRVDQHFCGRQAAAVGTDHQPLADHRLQVQREIHQHVLVRGFREEIQDAFDRLIGVVRVQCGQTQVAGFGERDRRFHGGGIQDFADKNDVRRFAHRVLQRIVECMRVQTDFALVYQRLLVLVQIFDGILDGEDMAGRSAVAVIDHRRQRGRLARTGGADDQHQPARRHDDVLQRLRQLQFLDAGNHAADRADDHAHFAALFEHVDAEPAGIGQRQRHVQLQIAFELRHLALVHQRIGDLFDHARRQAGIAERIQLAFDLDVHRRTGGQEHVGRVFVRHQLQEIADIHC